MSNIISATFSCGSTTSSACGLWQYDYGQRLVFAGLDLPPVYEVHFANEGETETVTVLGDETGVDIPDQFLLSGSAVRAWVFLHTGTEDGETMYAVRMPVNKRPEPSDIEPTPVQQDIITQAIAALDAAVEQTGQDVETTAGYMDRAEQAAEQAEQAAQGVEDYAERAETAAANAEASASSAGQSEQAATQSAQSALQAATQAGTSAGQAQQAASDAGQAATSAVSAAEQAEASATTAEAKAEEATASASAAAGSASSAAGSETVASQAAQTASQSATQASQSATNASNSATSAAQSATSAEQSAQSAEQSAESILDVLPEIQQDITNLQDTKADKNGSYDNLIAGLAEQLTTDQGVIDSVPYLMRPSGGGVAVGSYEQDKIVGGSVVWNQLCPKTAASKTVAGGVSVVNNGDGSFTFSGTSTSSERFQFSSGNDVNVPANHVLFIGGISGGSISTFYLVGSYQGSLRVNAYNDTVAKSSYAINQFSLRVINNNTFDTPITVKPQLVDLTAMFNPAIADYIYSLETATAGAGVAWLKQHFPKQFDSGYQEYNAGEIKSVGGLVSHEMRDADDNIIGSYPLDSELVLRGVPKLDANNQLYYDGDTYSADGTVERCYAERAYQSGDESLTDALTDGTVTVYKLTTPTTEQAAPYQTPQLVDPDGTEEYVLTEGAFPMPVGHETFYAVDLKKKIEDLPNSLVSDVQVGGVSVVQDGVAEIPQASDAEIKAGQAAKVITANSQFRSAFYGLAKAAGDTTQSASANAVGAYTDEAKKAIRKMLGIYEAPWELIREDTFTNETEADHIISVDGNGQAFELTDVVLMFETPKQATASAKGAYGQISFYADSDSITQIECGAWTQEANGTAHGLTAILRQEENLLITLASAQTTNSNSTAVRWRYAAGFTNPAQSVKWLQNRVAITLINIFKVTGTGHYKLFGKRKW